MLSLRSTAPLSSDRRIKTTSSSNSNKNLSIDPSSSRLRSRDKRMS
jgi:hypothetical protein